jgi:hypothetical protein
VSLNLLCASAFVAESLKSAISALGLVQAIGSRLSSEPSAVPLENLSVESSGLLTALKLDASL